MKFYDREVEIAQLREIDDRAERVAQFTVLIGRRRTGKTSLMIEALKDRRYLYFFIGKKTEQLHCAQFQQQVEEKLGLHIHGNVSSIAALIEELMIYSEQHKLTIIIDEFQRLAELNIDVISAIQDVWDRRHATAKIHIIACGSVYSMMKQIFENSHEPLFGRKTARIDLKPFSIATLKQILRDHNPDFTPDDLLMLYSITGGVAKYVAQLMDDGCRSWNDMLDDVYSPSSIFIDEGTELLVGEFGRRYNIYYSILQLIASGSTRQPEIDSKIDKNTGRYLDTLEHEYSIINKLRPMWAKPGSQSVRYYINDCFLTFWFRFIERNRQLVELGKLDLLKQLTLDGYPQFSGLMLEKYFRQLYSEKDRVTQVGHWWDKHGENEIDLIAISQLDNQAVVAEVKRNPEKFVSRRLDEKFERIKHNLQGYTTRLICLSLDDM